MRKFAAKSAATQQTSQNIAVLLTNHMPFLKPTMFSLSIESYVIIVQLSTENYHPTSKDLLSKISLIQ
jgi:hypothetical protein